VVAPTDLSVRFFSLVGERGLYSSPGNLRFYGRYLFDGIPLDGRAVLDVGGGTGIYTFYAAAAGARRAVCLEPEAAGATSGVTARFRDVFEALGRPEGVSLAPQTLEDFDPTQGPFDVVLLNNSVNHLDEEACVRLPGDPEARARYGRCFARLRGLLAPGGHLILTDCSNGNVFPRLGLTNPLLPMIEWPKHQSPEVWAGLLREAGFTDPRISWSSFNRLRAPGRLLLGNRVAAYFLTSHFRLAMRRA
jgi:SAM-dependent methyltransferase